ncbi:hypothetical protein G9G63_20120 [Paenibacillus sp. EKM202P]|uniref:hypothetical protein n=1 Tax=unclassified Paenibacillus TaxID=185978 RepID=UPI0013EB6493|nr:MULTISPECIES: hypothetical protein [unclassified Paenibacillus]KAF6561961.1 hypothetical protein G9G63_20120 [Paenibacillus sp. EKM202P]KAF6566249.1 hypothetical protein G9G64_19255 [Paenibacillus sp. EKM207P]
MQRQIKDPMYQTQLKQTVRDRSGRVIGEVFVLEHSMLLVKQSRKRKKRGKQI